MLPTLEMLTRIFLAVQLTSAPSQLIFSAESMLITACHPSMKWLAEEHEKFNFASMLSDLPDEANCCGFETEELE